MTVDRVVIGADGLVVLRPAPDRRDGGAAPARTAVRAWPSVRCSRTSREPLGCARASGPGRRPAAGRLDRAVAELPVDGVPAVARTLGEAAAGTDRGAVRAELGALAQAIGRHAGAGTARRAGGWPVHRGPPARRRRAATGASGMPDGGSARGSSRSWSSPGSSCWSTPSCATRSPPTSASCSTPGAAGRRRRPRRPPTVCRSCRPLPRPPAACAGWTCAPSPSAHRGCRAPCGCWSGSSRARVRRS